jgi:stage III sporulation protein AH
MLGEADLDSTQKAELALEAAALAKSIETEGKIENLLKAKGFEECMVYYDTKKVDIIVKSGADGLKDEQVAQMQDVVLGEVEIPAENIRIVEVK